MMKSLDSTQERRAFLRTAVGLAASASAWPMFAGAASPATAGAPNTASGTSSSGAAAPGGVRRSVIIDCDPGQDDAIAIMFALGASDRLDVGSGVGPVHHFYRWW